MATTTWAVLERSFISQGRKELLTPPHTHHLRGHSASLRVEIQVFCLRASLLWLTHLRVLLTRTFLWPPPFLLHKGGFIAWLTWAPGSNQGAKTPTGIKLKHQIPLWYVMSAKHPQTACLWSIVEECWRCNLDFKDEIQSLLHQQPMWRATVHTQKRSRMRAIHVTLVPLERLVISFNPQFV